MALAIDGYAVLGRIAANAVAFAGIRADVSKAAQALVTAQLRTKTATVENLRDVRKALGEASFALIVEALKDAQVKTLVTKFDKHHADMKSASAQARRRHLCVLADASVAPAQKPVRAKKPAVKSAGSKKAEPQRLSSEAMGARRDRR